jgi:serine/threonine protein kinase
MTYILKPGDILRTSLSNRECYIERYLGSGTQGEVYQALLGEEAVAVKWYKPDHATPEQREALEDLLPKRPTNEFLWPRELVKSDHVPDFGYWMPLREPRFKSLIDLLRERVDPGFRALTTVGIKLVHNYYQLHAKGLCYSDISWNNVFFDPDNGDIRICDNDNVGIDKKGYTSVKGTPRFMAPEIVRDEAKPSSDADRYSLAVLLFYLFMRHHPLEGRFRYDIECFNENAMCWLYGEHPVFIYDPNNASNRPVRGVYNTVILYWEQIYPQMLKDLFIKVFTEGIRDPQNGRVAETLWRKTLIEVRDLILHCGHCDAESFYDPDKSRDNSAYKPTCWQCKREITIPPILKVGSRLSRQVMLLSDTKLYPNHIDRFGAYDFSRPVAAMVENPGRPGVWGLQNLSSEPWTCRYPNGDETVIPLGRAIVINPGIVIDFGRGKERGELLVSQ